MPQIRFNPLDRGNSNQIGEHKERVLFEEQNRFQSPRSGKL